MSGVINKFYHPYFFNFFTAKISNRYQEGFNTTAKNTLPPNICSPTTFGQSFFPAFIFAVFLLFHCRNFPG